MNAPETLKPINDAHKVLMEANDALCVEDVARAILGGDKPTKADIKAAAKRLKELADIGMIEMEQRAGGVPLYRLISAPASNINEMREVGDIDVVESSREDSDRAVIPPPQYDPASVAFPASVVTRDPHTGMPRNLLDIESDPAGLLIVKDGEPMKAYQAEERILTPEAEAEREDFEARYGMLGNCSCHISPPCGSCTHPGNPRNQEEDETAWVAAGDSEGGETDAPAAAAGIPRYGQGLSCGACADGCPGEQCKVERDSPPISMNTAAAWPGQDAVKKLAEKLARIAELEATVALQSETLVTAAADFSRLSSEVATARQGARAALAQADDLRTRLAAALEIGHVWEREMKAAAGVDSPAEVTAVIEGLRAGLAIERQAREALQEQSGAVDVKDAAVGYLVRVPNRAPVLRRKPESARAAALSAVRAGAARAEVMAVVPGGTARRGAEWKGA